MIEPLLSDDSLLADVEQAGNESANAEAFCLWWLGQSGYLLQYRGRHLLIDPYLSDSLTEKYATTDKPHIRMMRRVIDPARLGFIDAVTASHQHTDHLDAPTLRAIVAANPKVQIAVPAAHLDLATERSGLPVSRLITLNDGDETDLGADRSGHGGFHLAALPSAHDQIEQDAAGNHKYLGYLIRFGRFTIYHSGDTRLYPGLAERLAVHKIDLALLPINGHDSARRVAGNLNGTEAAELAHRIGARCVIPGHYDMFTFNTADPQELFIPTCQNLSQPHRVLRAGERFDSRQIG